MKTKSKKANDEKLLPFCVIKAAAEGDILAIHEVLKHYEGYITSLSVRKMHDQYGRTHYCIDETLKRRLETKLLSTILSFKMIC